MFYLPVRYVDLPKAVEETPNMVCDKMCGADINVGSPVPTQVRGGAVGAFYSTSIGAGVPVILELRTL